MEHLTVIIGTGTRDRIQRIKYLRRERTGVILADAEIIAAAVACYCAELEKRKDDGN